jgi:hypothetical protein
VNSPLPCVVEGPFWDDNAGNEWVCRAVAPDGSTPLAEDGFPLLCWGHSSEEAEEAYLGVMERLYGTTAMAYAAQGFGYALWTYRQTYKDCPCCGRGRVNVQGDDICQTCWWHDDGYNAGDDEWSYANGLTLAEAQANVKAYGYSCPHGMWCGTGRYPDGYDPDGV